MVTQQFQHTRQVGILCLDSHFVDINPSGSNQLGNEKQEQKKPEDITPTATVSQQNLCEDSTLHLEMSNNKSNKIYNRFSSKIKKMTKWQPQLRKSNLYNTTTNNKLQQTIVTTNSKMRGVTTSAVSKADRESNNPNNGKEQKDNGDIENIVKSKNNSNYNDEIAKESIESQVTDADVLNTVTTHTHTTTEIETENKNDAYTQPLDPQSLQQVSLPQNANQIGPLNLTVQNCTNT